MRLYLMRHGQAESPSIDPQRDLTAEGKREIEQIANSLVKKSVHLDQVFHSGKRRAHQTAQVIAGIVAPDLSPQSMDNLKPNDNPEKIIDIIKQWTDDTLIVSHLPFIPTLLNRLTQTQHNIYFNPGTVACLNRSKDLWQLEWTADQ